MNYETKKNKEVPGYDQAKVCSESNITPGVSLSIWQDTFFDDMRVAYYGDNWLELLFPSLFFDKC